MDVKSEDLHSFGIFDIFRQTHKMIYTFRKIFTQVTLIFIHPLNFILLCFINSFISLSKKILIPYLPFVDLSVLFSPKWALFWPLNILNTIFLVGYSIVSTSAVVYAVASIFAGREVSLKQIMSVVSNIWKRLLITILCVVVVFVAYNLLALFSLILLVWTLICIYGPYGHVNGSIFVAFFLVYFAALLYLCVSLQMACVVCVLEESYGFKAMIKSMKLVKGKMVAATALLIVVSLCLVGIVVLDGQWMSFGVVGGVVLRLLSLFLLYVLLLWKLVLETMLYLVCKCYHNENIDKSALCYHLEVRLLNVQVRDVEFGKLQAN